MNNKLPDYVLNQLKEWIIMLSKAWDYMKLNKMIEKGDRIVIGVSGGADSVCLLYVLYEYCMEHAAELVVVHINHGIRGEEATEDEQFVKGLCDQLGVVYYSFSYNVRRIAKEQGISEEEAGRNVRYEAFLEICNQTGCKKIAIAHNKNDNAETVLFHLFRGSGMRGLTGIEPKRRITTASGEITVIRPLLSLSRKEIEEYLGKNSISYRTDSTNLTEDYSRNKIRNKILSYATAEINSGTVDNITVAAGLLREAQDYIEINIINKFQELVKQSENAYSISIRDICSEHIVIQKGIILRILEDLAGKRKDLEAKHVEAVLSLVDKQVGRYVQLPYGIIAERDYSYLRLTCEEPKGMEEATDIQIPLQILIPGKTEALQKHKWIETEIINYKNKITIPKSSCMKWFDYDKIENAVELRTRREGDYIQINSSGGNKKLKDYFIDRKIPRKLRDNQLLVTDGSHVMWIVGDEDRISEKYKVDDSTTRILLMKMFDLEEDANDR